MSYYLARMNARAVGEGVFGDELRKMSFSYNKKYKYWYRVVGGEIIQFLGMRRSSGGMYDLSFLCQPLFVPLFTGMIEDRRGAAPSFDAREASIILEDMIRQGVITGDRIPKLRGTLASHEEIRQHMRIAFDRVVRPTFEKSVDVASCYGEFARLRELRSRTIRGNSLEIWEDWRGIASLLELYSLMYLHRYEEASEVIRRDSAIRRRKQLPCVYEKYLQMLQAQDETTISELLEKSCRDTIAELQSYDFEILA